MPSEQQMKAVLEAYLAALNRGDLAGILDLYALDATVEDPVGAPLRSTREEIEQLYQQAVASGYTFRLSAPIRASHGDAAAMAFECCGPANGGRLKIHIIDVMRFNAAGKIRSMQAFWGPRDVVPEAV
jgi:steroid delta-isomerase